MTVHFWPDAASQGDALSREALETKRKSEIIAACVRAPTRLPPFMVMLNLVDFCHTYVEWDLYNAPAGPRNALFGLYACTTALFSGFHAFCVRGFAWKWS